MCKSFQHYNIDMAARHGRAHFTICDHCQHALSTNRRSYPCMSNQPAELPSVCSWLHLIAVLAQRQQAAAEVSTRCHYTSSVSTACNHTPTRSTQVQTCPGIRLRCMLMTTAVQLQQGLCACNMCSAITRCQQCRLAPCVA